MVAGGVNALFLCAALFAVQPTDESVGVPEPPPSAEPEASEPLADAAPTEAVAEADAADAAVAPGGAVGPSAEPEAEPPEFPTRHPGEVSDEEVEARLAGRAAERKEAEQKAVNKPPRPAGPARRGVVATAMLGYAGCSKPWCDGYRGGIGAGLELGFRFNRVMPVVAWNGGAGPYDKKQLSSEVGGELVGRSPVRMHIIGVGAWVFPLGKDSERRIDPHFGVRLGYASSKLEFQVGEATVEDTVKRGAVTLGGGLDGFVTDRFILGVRFDAHINWGGKNCIRVSAPGGSGSACADADDMESRTDPRDWPLPFGVMAQMRYVFPVP